MLISFKTFQSFQGLRRLRVEKNNFFLRQLDPNDLNIFKRFLNLETFHMATIKRFEDLDVWKVSRELCDKLGQIIDGDALKEISD